MRLLCWLALASAALAAPAPRPAGAPKDPAAALEGTWAALSYEGDGDYMPSPEAVRTAKLVLTKKGWCREEFREGKITFQSHFTTYRVSAIREPWKLDFVLRDPYDGNEVFYRGICELKGDTLRLCYTLKPYGPRPDSFKAPKGSRRVPSVWRREKK
jgi:uncharacterized protein (TIGR03067 family)